MEKRRVVGIYGGSFNPIHLGHTKLGEWLCQEDYVDELWFLVSPQNPLKQRADLMSDELRLRLARLAVEESNVLHVSDFEMQLPRPSYMVNTLASLRNAYPDNDFVLVIGADNWTCFSSWHKSEEILAHHDIIVYPREGNEIDTSTLPDNVRLVNAPLYKISSTEIRAAMKTPEYQGEWLHPKVWEELQHFIKLSAHLFPQDC